MFKVKFKFIGVNIKDGSEVESYATMDEWDITEAFKSKMADMGIVVLNADIVGSRSSVDDEEVDER